MNINDLAFSTGIVTESLPSAERGELINQLDGWEVQDNSRLVRRFRFETYPAALAFTQQVGKLAEYFNHHPEMLVEYNGVTVAWWTHTAGGITVNDIILARETHALIDAGSE